MSKILGNYIDSFESKKFGFDTQKERLSLVGFMPQQCNANSAPDKDGVIRTWFQVAGLYESSYDRKDENGEIFSADNSTIKTLVVKFKAEHLKKYGVTTSQLKQFLESNYIGKKMLILPTDEEKQSKKMIGDKSIPLVNQTEATVQDNFDLYVFCELNQNIDKSLFDIKKV